MSIKMKRFKLKASNLQLVFVMYMCHSEWVIENQMNLYTQFLNFLFS